MNFYSKNINNEIAKINQFWGGSLYILQSLFPNSSFLEKLRIKNVEATSLKLQQNLLKEGLDFWPVVQVDRRENLSREEFIESYLDKSLPVIFNSEALSWDCCKKWNLDYFQQKMGSATIQFTESTDLIEKEFAPQEKHEIPFVSDEMSAQNFATAVKNGENKYLRFSNILDHNKDLLGEINHTWLKKMSQSFLGLGVQSFIGAAKRKTLIHSETSFFYIMAYGEKKWQLYSAFSSVVLNPCPLRKAYTFSKINLNQPDLEKYKGFDLITKFECHLKKGDILYVPNWMWHEVENITESWGVSCRFSSIRSYLKNPAYAFVKIFLSKPSILPMVFRALKARLYKNSTDENLLIPLTRGPSDE